MEKKKKLDELTKSKLIYSGELLFFSILFLVLAILILLGIIPVKDWKKIAFTYVTLIGGFLLIGDFIWLLCSKKRRAKNPLIDKILVLPSATFLIGYDLYVLISNNDSFIATVMGSVFIYLSVIYLFQSIYHYFVPHPLLLESDEEDKKEEKKGSLNESQIEDKAEDKTLKEGDEK